MIAANLAVVGPIDLLALLLTMTRKLIIEYDDALIAGSGITPDSFAADARLLLAAAMYQTGRLSSGQAARLAGFSRVDFLLELPRMGLPSSNLRSEDLEDDLKFARHV